VAYGPVGELAEAVGGRRVRAVAAVEEALRRIAADDGPLNSVAALRADEALAEAAAVDAALDAGRPAGPLAGVPVLVKDLEDVTGMPTRKGSLLLADVAPAERDGLATERLRGAGAVVVGKSTLCEFAAEGHTSSPLTGITRNPWDRTSSPGGSSGGSGAAISAGLVPVATGTDGGGSIRIPSAFCGLVGIKATRGVVPRRPTQDWLDLSTDGPMATTVADLRLLLGVWAGAEPGDPEAWPGSGVPAVPGPLAGRPPARVVVAPRTSDQGPLPADVAQAFAAASAAFTALFPQAAVAAVDPADGSLGLDLGHDWATLAAADHVGSLGRAWVEERLDRMSPYARDLLGYGLHVTIDDYVAARRRRFGFTRVLDLLLGDDGVLLTPTVAVGRILADGRLSEDAPYDGLPGEIYSTELQNLTGHPAVSLPAGQIGAVPFGLQVTGPRYADGWLLELAERWEQAYPWPRQAPGYAPFQVA
jgi:Asp-tRNA(Asn)/Glu-tRNA(Gln) amidotransferase A subunit family amidase